MSGRSLKREPETAAPPWGPRGRLLLRWVCRGLLLLALAILVDIVYALVTLPAIPPGGFDASRPSVVISADGEQVGPLSGGIYRVPSGLDDMPDYLPEAFIASEDARFREHLGIDPRGIARAVATNLQSRGIREGGSTITQQVVKNTFLTADQSLRRKWQEAAISLWIERKYTKDEILSVYLNQLYLGHGTYGVGAGARAYFDKPVSELTLGEAATLAGITPGPESFSPLRHPDRALQRRNLVLDRMVVAGVIDPQTAEHEKAQPLHTSPGQVDIASKYPWYMDAVRAELTERFGLDERMVELMGLKIYTGLDPALQGAAEKALAARRFPDAAPDGLEAAFAAVDPRSGQVRALVGGRQYQVAAGFNRAVHGQVPPGSVLKPVVAYGPAFEHAGLEPDSRLADAPLNIDGWQPQNWDGQFRGEVTVREAARLSLNIPTIHMLQQVGVTKARSFAESVGVPLSAEDQSLALALGAVARGVSPLQISGAYQPFANGGSYYEPHLVVKVETAGGSNISPRGIKSKRVMRSRAAYLVTDILKTVVQNGTGTRALLDRPMAGKTGTVELPDLPEFAGKTGNAAAWFVGYTPDLVASVWVGYDQIDAEHYLPESVNGSSFPAIIWREAVGAALVGRQVLQFPGPDGKVPQQRSTERPAPQPSAEPEPEEVELPSITSLRASPGETPGSVRLTWEVHAGTTAPEALRYLVFRGDTPDFPAEQNLVAEVPSLSFTDLPQASGNYFYRVAVLDPETRQMGPLSETIRVMVSREVTPPEAPEEPEPPEEQEPPGEAEPPIEPKPPTDVKPPEEKEPPKEVDPPGIPAPGN